MPRDLPDVRCCASLAAYLDAFPGSARRDHSDAPVTLSWLTHRMGQRAGKAIGSGTLSNVKAGKRALSLTKAELLASVLGLTGEQRETFFDLVHLQFDEPAAAADARRARLAAARRRAGDASMVGQDVAYMRLWQSFVGHAMVWLRDFDPDLTWLRERLREPPDEAVLMEILTLVERMPTVDSGDGKHSWRAKENEVQVRPGDADQRAAIVAFHQEAADRASRALEDLSRKQRQVLTRIFAAPSARLPGIMARLEHLVGEFESVPESDTVYQLQISLIPLTKNAPCGA